jgi:hypothetical protein
LGKGPCMTPYAAMVGAYLLLDALPRCIHMAMLHQRQQRTRERRRIAHASNPRRLLMTGCTMTDWCCIMCPDAPPTTQQLCPRCCSGWRVGIRRDRWLRWVDSRQRQPNAEAEGGEEGRTWRQIQVRAQYPATHARSHARTHTHTHIHIHIHIHTHTPKKIVCWCWCLPASDAPPLSLSPVDSAVRISVIRKRR